MIFCLPHPPVSNRDVDAGSVRQSNWTRCPGCTRKGAGRGPHRGRRRRLPTPVGNGQPPRRSRQPEPGKGRATGKADADCRRLPVSARRDAAGAALAALRTVRRGGGGQDAARCPARLESSGAYFIDGIHDSGRLFVLVYHKRAHKKTGSRACLAMPYFMPIEPCSARRTAGRPLPSSRTLWR